MRLIRRVTHERILAAQVREEAAKRDRLQEGFHTALAEFKREMTEQAARENAALRNENLRLRDEVAALKGKLVHVIDNPSPARFVKGDGR